MGMRTRRGPATGLADALITALSVVSIVGGARFASDSGEGFVSCLLLSARTK